MEVSPRVKQQEIHLIPRSDLTLLHREFNIAKESEMLRPYEAPPKVDLTVVNSFNFLSTLGIIGMLLLKSVKRCKTAVIPDVRKVTSRYPTAVNKLMHIVNPRPAGPDLQHP